MNTFEDLQNEVLRLPSADRCRLAIAVLDSLDDEPADGGVAEAWAAETRKVHHGEVINRF